MLHSHTFVPNQPNNESAAGEAPLHIAFGVDQYYAPAMGVTMISIAANNPESRIIFHVITTSPSSDDLRTLARLAQQLQTTIKVYDLDREVFPRHDRNSLTHAAYNRLFLCEILKEVATHVLYLDSDIVCLRALPPLPELGDAVAAVVLDVELEDRNAGIGRPATTPYFNSGVMYIDVKRWNERDITNKAIEALLADKKRRFWDQDALNLALAGQVTWLDGKWNAFWAYRSMYPDAVFLHYPLGKPWQQWSPAFLDPPFARYFNQSPWPAQRLLHPVSRKHRGQYARYLFENGKFLRASLWRIRSLCTPRN